MRYLNIVLLLIAISGCTSGTETHKETTDSTANPNNTIVDDGTTERPLTKSDSSSAIAPVPADTAKVSSHSNKRFKDVTVARLGEHKFRIKGKGQIFEASFGWYIEDGHNELKTGFAMTDAGAPEWGNFDFTVDSVIKKRPNSTLHLVLFETSANDGSRQYELPLRLY